jgi:ABC-type branched-subunit amino acid transport system ATPase component
MTSDACGRYSEVSLTTLTLKSTSSPGNAAVDDASIEVPAGGFVGLIGPNGAGKTTLFNAICGFVTPTRGRIRFGDADITGMTPSRRAKLGIGRTFQKLELFARMSVFDNLMVAAEAGASRLDVASDLLHLPRRSKEERRCADIAKGIVSELGLEWAVERRASDLPIGTARILELGRALCTNPKLLLLDEPSSGLDSNETREFGKLLKRINADHDTSILLVEHDMDLVMEVCQEIYVLDFGRMIALGDPETVRRDPAVVEAYLGEET